MNAKNATFLLLIAAIVGLAGAAQAANVWLSPDRGNEVRLEIVKPAFSRLDLTFASAIWYLSAYGSVGHGRYLNAELPYAHFGLKDDRSSLDDYSSTVGNPYLGIEYGDAWHGFTSDFGGRLPLASDSEWASGAAILADPVNNWEAFMPKVASVTLGLGYRDISPMGLGLRFRVAPTAWFDTGEALADGMELWLLYSVQVEQRQGPVAVGVGLSGRYWVTEDVEGGFGARTQHELDLYCNLWFRSVRPTVRVRVPLDEDLTSYLDPSLVLGAGFGID